jgi:peptidyl-tRNA hydrolase
VPVKQVIVIRRDLKMRRGKECAQVAHASMKVFFDRMQLVGDHYEIPYLSLQMDEWIQGLFTKIVCHIKLEV